MGEIILGDNLDVLRTLPDGAFQLIYVDPPFNTGKAQSRTRIKVTPDPDGDRTGFQGRRYKTRVVGSSAYADVFDDYVGFLRPRMAEAYRTLDDRGSLFFHVDYREVHYCKVMLDEIFGRSPSSTKSSGPTTTAAGPKPAGRPSTTTSSGTPKTRITTPSTTTPWIASPTWLPGLVGPEKAARGKRPRTCGGKL